jgi:hypothetical protein
MLGVGWQSPRSILQTGEWRMTVPLLSRLQASFKVQAWNSIPSRVDWAGLWRILSLRQTASRTPPARARNPPIEAGH